MLKQKNKKIDLIKNLSLKTGLSRNYSKKIINDLINILILNIKSGSLNLKNIGSFLIKEKKERIGRNPKTKVEYIISSRKTVIFHPSKKISKKLENSQ